MTDRDIQSTPHSKDSINSSSSKGTGTTGSSTPGRRQKRPPIPATSPSSAASAPTAPASTSSRPLPPLRPYAPRPSTLASLASLVSPENPPPPAPAKRGRKPGPLSRTAREAQRRLNHSIIEKARRTKINDALADLRALVPVDSGGGRSDNDAEDNEDDDYDEGGDKGDTKSTSSKGGKGKGKKEEKEKEFKLEILVRTVTFLRTLLARVTVLEDAAASTGFAVLPAALSGVTAAASVSTTEDQQTPGQQPTHCTACQAPLACSVTALPRGMKRKRTATGDDRDGYTSDIENDESTSRSSPTPPPPPRRPPLKRRTRVPAEASKAPEPSPCKEDANMDTPEVDRERNNMDVERLYLDPPTRASEVNVPKAYTPNTNATPALPPLSAWLACVLDSTHDQPPTARTPKGAAHAYPSPPDSVRMQPVGVSNRERDGLPFLSLGPRALPVPIPVPSATGFQSGRSVSSALPNKHMSTPVHAAAVHATTPPRTPEDESAASLLLGIAASPPLLPSLGLSSSREGRYVYEDRYLGQPQAQVTIQAQTPSSLLGLDLTQSLARRP